MTGAWSAFSRLARLETIRYSRRVSSRFRALLLLSVVGLVAACGAKRPKVDDSVPPAWLKNIPVAPLEISEYRVGEAEGEHAIFLRLSRFPDSTGYTVQETPPEIVVQLEGPAVGEDVAEERVVVADSIIPAVRVSRKGGNLTVVVEVTTPEVPPYIIDEAADWLIVRVRPGK